MKAIKHILLFMLLPLISFGQDTLDVGEVRIIAPDIYKTIYDTLTHHDTTRTVIENDLSVLRGVYYQFRKTDCGNANCIDVYGVSHVDSIDVAFYDSLGLVKKKILANPDTSFRAIIQTDYLGPATVIVSASGSPYRASWHQPINTAFHDTLGGQQSIDMALPTTGYSTPAGWTNPSSDLTDFVFWIPATNLPQDFYDAIDTSDMARGRVAKDDGTELASDWSEFDEVNQTGGIWAIWTGTLSSTSNVVPRVYPPKSANASYASTATFGSEAVWVNYLAVHHLNEDPSGTAPQFKDATGNGHDLTSEGAMTSADVVTGKLGNAIEFDGVDDRLSSGDYIVNQATAGYYMSAWVRVTRLADYQGIFGEYEYPDGVGLATWNDGDLRGLHQTETNLNGADNFAGGAFHYITQNWDGSTVTAAFDDLTPPPTEARTDSPTANNKAGFSYGVSWDSGGNLLEGAVEDLRFSTSPRSTDYRSLEYQNQNDPATFWGAWSWNAGSGGTTISGTAALTGGQSLFSAPGDVAISGQSAIDTLGQLPDLTGVLSLSLTTVLTDGNTALAAQAATKLAGTASVLGGESQPSLSGSLDLSGSANMDGAGSATSLQGVLVLDGSAAIDGSAQQLDLLGSFGDIIRGTAGLVDSESQAAAGGQLLLSGAGGITANSATLSIDGNIILAAQAALDTGEQSFQALADLLLSMSVALTDNPEQVLIRELVISEKVKITVTGARAGNTITITGERVDNSQAISAARVPGNITVTE